MKSIFTKDEEAAIMNAASEQIKTGNASPRLLVAYVMARIGRAGGKAGTGAAKRRPVDYAELGRRGAEARKRKKEAPQ
jgi:hypothetical protein